jgi:2-keto-3-deoxy-L-arabinonate dehydratase
MMEGGVIHSDTTRHPFASMHPSTRAGLLKVARRLDPLVLSWGK